MRFCAELNHTICANLQNKSCVVNSFGLFPNKILYLVNMSTYLYNENVTCTQVANARWQIGKVLSRYKGPGQFVARVRQWSADKTWTNPRYK